MRIFYDIEQRKFVSEYELLEEFFNLMMESPSEYGNITFEQFLNNCMTTNNGTLTEV